MPFAPNGRSEGWSLLLEELRRDSRRYRGWLSNLGFWVGFTYRLGAWARTQPFPVRLLFGATARAMELPWQWFLNIHLPFSAKIGPGLCFPHPSNIFFAPTMKIGDDCLIFHEVTLGLGPRPGIPCIGDRVDIFVGARVLGGVTVGDDVQIGANCVVTRDVPAGAVVVSATPRVLPRELIERFPNGRDARRARADAEEQREGQDKDD